MFFFMSAPFLEKSSKLYLRIRIKPGPAFQFPMRALGVVLVGWNEILVAQMKGDAVDLFLQHVQVT